MFPNQMRVLVVDDMAAMRTRIVNQLKLVGFTNIDQAADGQEAYDMLERLRGESEAVHLIISDWNMPVMTGINFLKKVKGNKAYEKIPFIMVTAEGEKSQVIKALQLGVDDYLIKPVEKDVLEKKILALWTRKLVS